MEVTTSSSSSASSATPSQPADPRLKPYLKMKSIGVPLPAVLQKMRRDGVDAAPPTGVDATANDSRNSSNREAGDEGDEDVDDNDDAKTQSLE